MIPEGAWPQTLRGGAPGIPMCPSVQQGTCPQGESHPAPPLGTPEKSQRRRGSRESKLESWVLLEPSLPSRQGCPPPGPPLPLGLGEILALKDAVVPGWGHRIQPPAARRAGVSGAGHSEGLSGIQLLPGVETGSGWLLGTVPRAEPSPRSMGRPRTRVWCKTPVPKFPVPKLGWLTTFGVWMSPLPRDIPPSPPRLPAP